MNSFRNLVDELFVSWACDVTPGFRWCDVQLYPIAWSLWTKLPENGKHEHMSKINISTHISIGNRYHVLCGTPVCAPAQINNNKKLIMFEFGFMSNKSQFELRLFTRFMSHTRARLCLHSNTAQCGWFLRPIAYSSRTHFAYRTSGK